MIRVIRICTKRKHARSPAHLVTHHTPAGEATALLTFCTGHLNLHLLLFSHDFSLMLISN